MGLRAPQAPGVAQPPKQPLPEFDVQRKKVEQRANAAAQGQQDALQRRFAANGMLNSGAAIKQQQIAANEANTQREDALQAVDAAEISEAQRRQEVQDQMAFASGEAQKGREFQGSESALARAMQGSQFDRSLAQSGSQFDKNFGLQKQQLGYDRQDQAWNKAIAGAQLKGDQLGRFNSVYQGMGGKPLPGTSPQPAIGYGTFGQGAPRLGMAAGLANGPTGNPFTRRLGVR